MQIDHPGRGIEASDLLTNFIALSLVLPVLFFRKIFNIYCLVPICFFLAAKFVSSASESYEPTRIGLLINLVQLSLLFALFWLTSKVSYQLNVVADLVACGVLPKKHAKVKSQEEITTEIEKELSRCRRHNRPLSLLIVKPDVDSVDLQQSGNLLKVMEKDLAVRYVFSKLGVQIADMLRQTDLVVENPNDGEIIIFCPETEAGQLENVRKRIKTLADDQLDVGVAFGTSSLTQGAYTLNSLISEASADLNNGNVSLTDIFSSQHVNVTMPHKE